MENSVVETMLVLPTISVDNVIEKPYAPDSAPARTKALFRFPVQAFDFVLATAIGLGAAAVGVTRIVEAVAR